MKNILGTKAQMALSVVKINNGVEFKDNLNRDLSRQCKKTKVAY